MSYIFSSFEVVFDGHGACVCSVWRFRVLGFRVLGFRVLGFRVWGLGFRV